MRSDGELLRAWGEGDSDAAEALFERHFEALYRFFRNKVSDEVHDLVQDTFLRMVKASADFRGDASFRGFLFGVARNVLHDHLRRLYRTRDHIDFTTVSAIDLDPSPSRWAARRQEHRLLLAALRRIPLDHQIALELAYWEGLKGPEIAAVLGLQPATARTRLRRARAALAGELNALARDPQILASTLDNLDHWAQSLREYIEHDREQDALSSETKR